MFDFENDFESEESDENKQQIKNDIFSKAYRLAARDDIDSLEQAVDLFASIPDFKDAAQRMSACQQKLSELKRELAIKKEKEEKLKAKKAKQKAVTILSIVLIAAALIVGIPLKSKIDHDVNRIKIDIVNMSSSYNHNESVYINGRYYIYFDFEIKNGTGAGIDYMEVVTYVEDKNGKSIGQITSSFGGYYSSSMNLEKKDTVIKEIYLAEHQPEKNAFFSTMYDTKLDEWSFTHKVTSVSFSDGKNYFGE